MDERPSRIVFLGKPGTGKGTQASFLSETLGIPHLSSGEILREEIREGTDFGLAVERYVRKGEIGPQELIAGVIIGHLERRGAGDAYILDGFPRTLHQARELDARFPPARAILLSVPDRIIIERISGRLTCSDCGSIRHAAGDAAGSAEICTACGGRLVRRIDDHPEAIARRLETFAAEVVPVIRFYEESDRLSQIDGTLPMQEVRSMILSLFGADI
jgi:adenylate kinase